ncbi:MAG: hypothetical protein A2X64_03510 [Ignavibacteria bacterium GWF2_33_9]|nr:MAG: hypothetical protein A2X64_03510 [Ignavibacteria bacterium GWF2_33_9]
MNKIIKTYSLILILFLIFGMAAQANVAPEYRNSKKNKGNNSNQIQRVYSTVYDNQRNSISNFQFYTTNYGIFGLDVGLNTGGGFWPRGSANQYLFGGGIWFAAKKQRPGTTDPDSLKKLVSITYNPNSGNSWFVPGIIDDGDPIDDADILKYRTTFSTDFKPNGNPINSADTYKWPIWDIKGSEDTLKNNRYFGQYVNNDGMRNTDAYPKGPAFISGEDIFAVYKDTDLRRYEGGAAKMTQEGYPLRLQIEQTIYSWGFGDYRDFIFIAYNITNRSNDLLRECWLAPVMDVDIAIATNASSGAGNDRVKYYDAEPDLNLALQWSNGDRGERNNGFGYLGFDFLESPAVDGNGFPRRDKKVFESNEQLGLVTFRNWPIDEDLKESEERYNFMASRQRDGESDAGDQRFMMATGPFNLNPMDTVRVVVGVVLANTTKGSDADGSNEDLAELVRKDKFAQSVYDNNFRAPIPPNKSIILNTNPLNHGVQFSWDETAERSFDAEERGLDFMGFKIYRARRPDLDTFEISQSNTKGPFGWKQLFQAEIPKPFRKSSILGGTDGDLSNPLIDSLCILGPYIDRATGKVIDTMAIRVMKIPAGAGLFSTASVFQGTGTAYPVIGAMDTSIYSQPWGTIYRKMLEEDGININEQSVVWNINNNVKLFDSVCAGVAYLNPALHKYNPLYFRKKTIQISKAELDKILADFPDGIVGQTTTYYDSAAGKDVTVRVTTDTVYVLSTFKEANIGGNASGVIDMFTKRSISQIMTDTTHVQETIAFLYDCIQNNSVKFEFPDWEGSNRAINEGIVPYMKTVTANNTFTDIGDDNKDGHINRDADPTLSEELVNNIKYYYKVVAYDEGDYMLQTKQKQNEGIASATRIEEHTTNVAVVKPSAGTASEDPSFEVIISPQDSILLGGLYNFRMFAIDRDRLLKNFAGHTLELTFNPYWNQQSINLKGTTNETDATRFGLYQRRAVLKDLNTGQTVFDAIMSMEQQPCYVPYRGGFTENGASFVLADSVVIDTVSHEEIRFGIKNNLEKRNFSGSFSTGSFRDADPAYCYTLQTLAPAYGTLGFGFDFGMQQWGGWYRPDSTSFETIKSPDEDAKTRVIMLDEEEGSFRNFNDIMVTQPVGVDPTISNQYIVYGSFNNGPGNYTVTFEPGGKDTLDLTWGGKPPKNTESTKFIVDYLTMKITNDISFNRISELGPDSVEVKSPTNVEPMVLPMQGENLILPSQFPDRLFPDPRNLGFGGVDRLNPRTNEFIGHFNLAPYGYIDARGSNYNSALNAPKQIARPNYEPYVSTNLTYIDRQNRYYLSATSIDGQHTIDFTHNLNVNGIQVAFDHANKGRFQSDKRWEPLPDNEWTFNEPDFQAGDVINFRVAGGALGMPWPGAKVVFKINEPEGFNGNYTDDILGKVKVVPNPYFISHQGQKSPYDDEKIFFTKLPTECTIDIYTINGDLVKTIEHKDNGYDKESSASTGVWDLLSYNAMRVQSQAFVAVITTPDGAQTIKNFAVVVGGFRVIPE